MTRHVAVVGRWLKDCRPVEKVANQRLVVAVPLKISSALRLPKDRVVTGSFDSPNVLAPVAEWDEVAHLRSSAQRLEVSNARRAFRQTLLARDRPRLERLLRRSAKRRSRLGERLRPTPHITPGAMASGTPIAVKCCGQTIRRTFYGSPVRIKCPRCRSVHEFR